MRPVSDPGPYPGWFPPKPSRFARSSTESETPTARPHTELPPTRSGTSSSTRPRDLSPMQWRMLARRCPSGSFTIVGDLGQAKHPWSPNDWVDACSLAAPEHPCRVEKLTVNYRTPAEVMTLAAAVLAKHRPHLVPPTAVRMAASCPGSSPCPPDKTWLQPLGRSAAEEAATVNPGKVAIIRAELSSDPSGPCRPGLAGDPRPADSRAPDHRSPGARVRQRHHRRASQLHGGRTIRRTHPHHLPAHLAPRPTPTPVIPQELCARDQARPET